MYELKKIGKVFTSKSVGTGPSSYEERICRPAVSQRLRSTSLNALTFQKLSLTCCIVRLNSYRAVNTSNLDYRDQPVDTVQGNNHCLF